MTYIPRNVKVHTAPVAVWQTTTGVAPDPAVTHAAGIYQAHGPNDPLPLILVLPATKTVYVTNPTTTHTTQDVALPKGATIPFNVVGNDTLYLLCATTVTVGVIVGRGG
jgi:hypothetical protein